MINVSDNLRKTLDSNNRVGIERVVEMSSYVEFEDLTQKFEIVELTSSPSDFESASNGLALRIYPPGRAAYEAEYADYFSWDYFDYDTTNPKIFYNSSNPEPTGVITTLPINYSYGHGGVPYVRFTYEATTAGAEYETNSVTVEFGKNENVYPRDVTIQCLDKDGNYTADVSFYNTSNLVSVVFDQAVKVHEVYIRLIDMEGGGSGDDSVLNVPNHRIKISKVFLGYTKVFSDEIVSLSVNRESSPLTDEMPNIEASLMIWDINRLFDKENPKGLYGVLTDDVVFKDYIVYEDEKVLINTYVLSEIPEVDGSQTTFKLTSYLLNALARNNRNYTLTASPTEIPTTYVNNVIKSAVKPIASAYFHSTDVFIPISTARDYTHTSCTATEVLQKATNASAYMLTEGETGQIHLKEMFYNYIWGNDTYNYITYLTTDARPLISDIMCGEAVIDRDSILPIECNVNWYSGGDIAGYVDENIVTHAGEEGGETADYVLDNDFCLTEWHAKFLAYNYVCYQQGKKWTIPYFTDPTIQIGDFVSFSDYYGVTHYGIVVGTNYTYPSSAEDNLTIFVIDSLVTYPVRYVSWDDVVTTINSTNTNSQIPTAKAVYDAFGDISALL